MKAICVGAVCVLLLAVGAATVRGQAFPAKIKLTCITTNSSGFVKTKITEKDFVAYCASETHLDPSRLKLVFANGDLLVLDTVATNVACLVATVSGEIPTNVFVGYYSGANSNKLQAATFTPFNSDGEGVLPADFSGTLYTTYRLTEPSNSVTAIVLKGTIQGGSATNDAIYIGTLSAGGKPITLPPR